MWCAKLTLLQLHSVPCSLSIADKWCRDYLAKNQYFILRKHYYESILKHCVLFCKCRCLWMKSFNDDRYGCAIRKIVLFRTLFIYMYDKEITPTWNCFARMCNDDQFSLSLLLFVDCAVYMLMVASCIILYFHLSDETVHPKTDSFC